jgi:hypothetical protein
MPPSFNNTPPTYAYNTETSDTEVDENTINCNHITLTCTAISKEEERQEQNQLIIGDNGCNAIIFNYKNQHLAYDLEPINGTVIGATGPKPGAVKFRGFVDYMGVKCRCYVADITKSCIGLNYTAYHYGFVYGIEGNILSIYSTRSGRSTELLMNKTLLSEMPESLFGQIEIDMNITTLDSKDLYTLIHCRLGHPNEDKVRYMASQKLYQQRGITLEGSNIKAGSQYCDICAEAKGHKVVSHREVDKDASELGTTWHADLPGQSETPSIVDKHHSRIILTERVSRFRVYISLKNNSENCVLEAMKYWYRMYIVPIIERYERTRPTVPIHLYADNGEMKYPMVRDFLKAKLTFLHYTAPGHSSSNGLAEVGIKAIRTVSRSLLATYKLPEEFWERAEIHAVYLLNRLPFMYKGRYAVDPLTLYTGKTADYSILRIFGSKVHIFNYVKKDSRPRAVHGIFVGYATDSITPKIYIPTDDKFVDSANISFRETDENPMSVQQPPKEADFVKVNIKDFTQSEKTQN